MSDHLYRVRANSGRWSTEQAKAWQASTGYLAGANFVPSTASNQLEMFQLESYDPGTIDRELLWLAGMGFNTVRVYLHHLLYFQDPEGFIQRIDNFLWICEQHKIRVILVFFDSCWNGQPKLGKQPDPVPGVHNSRWVQCPGTPIVHDETQFYRLKPYVQAVIGKFRRDRRVVMWDLWNEPNNSNYKDEVICPLLKRAFDWARDMVPSQPLTTGVWQSLLMGQLTPFQRMQLDLSDVLSFHSYDPIDKLCIAIRTIRQYDAERPIVCTEYMARTAGSRFDPCLRLLREENIGAINWGFIAGRSQTFFSWDTLHTPATTAEPAMWFHDVIRPSGVPFDDNEVVFLRRLLLGEEWHHRK